MSKARDGLRLQHRKFQAEARRGLASDGPDAGKDQPDGRVTKPLKRIRDQSLFHRKLEASGRSLRVAAEEAMKSTAKNTKASFLICLSYTSSDAIVHAVQEACESKRREVETLV